MSSIAFVMPVFNEEGGIQNFVDEIMGFATEVELEVIVVDDASTDGTSQVLSKLKAAYPNFHWESNSRNLGHGLSTLKALRLGLATEAAVIVATDGDGNIRAEDLVELANIASAQKALAEGSRHNRQDPLFRKFASLATRALVWIRTGIQPADANTPHRAYPRDVLERLLREIPADSLTPNLHFSSAARSTNLTIVEHPVLSVTRQGSTVTGTTWKQRTSFLPSKKFIVFCWRAARQWLGSKGPRTEVQSQAHSANRFFFGRGSVGRYAAIGVSGATLDFLVFWLLYFVGIHPVVATVISTPVGIINNFVLNSALNFRTHLTSARGFRFLTVGVSGLALSAGLLQLLVTWGIEPTLAKAITIPIVVSGQFMANRSWTFRGVR